jgi:uncharacterized protein involved in cysteine biosynthesis
MENVVEKNTTLNNDTFDSKMIVLVVVNGFLFSILRNILGEFYSRDVARYLALTISVFILANALFFFDFDKNWLKTLLKQYFTNKFILWLAMNAAVILLISTGFLLFQIFESLVSKIIELFNLQIPSYVDSVAKFTLTFVGIIGVLKLCFYFADKIQNKS